MWNNFGNKIPFYGDGITLYAEVVFSSNIRIIAKKDLLKIQLRCTTCEIKLNH